MKKIVIVIALVLVAAVSMTGIVLAQTPQPPTPGTWGPMMGGRAATGVEGPLHDYMVNAMAAALGITPSDFETRQDAGKTAYQIALDLGISADKIPALLADARAKALDAAAADGVLSKQQADWMKSRGGGAYGLGNCGGMMGGGYGRGMMGGGRWQQTNP